MFTRYAFRHLVHSNDVLIEKRKVFAAVGTLFGNFGLFVFYLRVTIENRGGSVNGVAFRTRKVKAAFAFVSMLIFDVQRQNLLFDEGFAADLANMISLLQVIALVVDEHLLMPDKDAVASRRQRAWNQVIFVL